MATFVVVRKLWKSVYASDIAYMHTQQLCGRLVGGGEGGGAGRGDWAWVSSLAQHVVVLANIYMYISVCKYHVRSAHVIELVFPDHKCAHAQPLSPH